MERAKGVVRGGVDEQGNRVDQYGNIIGSASDIKKARKAIEVPDPTPEEPERTKLVYEDSGKTDAEEKAEAAAAKAKAEAEAKAKTAPVNEEPKREDFPEGLPGVAAWNKAMSEYRKKKKTSTGPQSPYPEMG